MKRGILIGMAVVIATLASMGAISKGRGYLYSARTHGSTTSVCTTPGDWEVYTVTFTIGVKNVDYPMLIIDLDDDDLGWPHVGTADHIISLSTTTTVSGAFTGDISFGVISDSTATDATHNPFHFELYNAYNEGTLPFFIDYGLHPISCRAAEIFGLAETLTNFQSDVAVTGPDGGGYMAEDGDVVLFIDVGAGALAMSGTIQYIISAN